MGVSGTKQLVDFCCISFDTKQLLNKHKIKKIQIYVIKKY